MEWSKYKNRSIIILPLFVWSYVRRPTTARVHFVFLFRSVPSLYFSLFKSPFGLQPPTFFCPKVGYRSPAAHELAVHSTTTICVMLTKRKKYSELWVHEKMIMCFRWRNSCILFIPHLHNFTFSFLKPILYFIVNCSVYNNTEVTHQKLLAYILWKIK